MQQISCFLRHTDVVGNENAQKATELVNEAGCVMECVLEVHMTQLEAIHSTA
jgi:hypothetical protein